MIMIPICELTTVRNNFIDLCAGKYYVGWLVLYESENNYHNILLSSAAREVRRRQHPPPRQLNIHILCESTVSPRTPFLNINHNYNIVRVGYGNNYRIVSALSRQVDTLYIELEFGAILNPRAELMNSRQTREIVKVKPHHKLLLAG